MAVEETSGQEKCTRLYVLSAGRNVKYHSSQQTASQFSAKIATKRKKASKKKILKRTFTNLFFIFIISFIILFYCQYAHFFPNAIKTFLKED